MLVLRLFLTAAFLAIAGYTVVVVLNHGWTLIPVFLANMSAMDWSGQFNLDFASYLLLSALWLAWRHDFSPAGLAFGLAGAGLGMLFLSVYLLIASAQAKGDIRALLLGPRRARIMRAENGA